MTFVIGQIQEELKLDLAYQRIPSKLICQSGRWGDDCNNQDWCPN
jgi:hypothetical protein